ncbi:hypothetical protein BDF19DRAFT_423703 [Syncephalis fuscata]|nr:hypothetical protein BDF19DRAFT_423703 [Syncephalis fuscata]
MVSARNRTRNPRGAEKSGRGGRAQSSRPAAPAGSASGESKSVFSSLSDRFQQISQQRVSHAQTMKPKSESNLRLAPQLGAKVRGQQQQKLRTAAGQRPTNASRAAGRGRRGRSQRGTGRQAKPVTKEQLDRELDNYAMRDTELARNKLDNDLDAYMADIQTDGKAA